tara:strand:+ start:29 stop:307 length:279 start_codon:yes stop_codon:yes gene_type:complete
MSIISNAKEPRYPMLCYPQLVKKDKKDRGVYVYINFDNVSHFFECRDPSIPEIPDPDGGKAFATTVVMKNGDKIHVARMFMNFANDMLYGKG